MTELRKRTLEALKSAHGKDAVLTPAQIKETCAKHDIKYPYWITNDKNRLVSRVNIRFLLMTFQMLI